jgi:hypothetical protein
MHGQESNDDRSFTQPIFGRRLRGHFGEAMNGLDDAMAALLEKLFEIPGLAERAMPDGAQRRER